MVCLEELGRCQVLQEQSQPSDCQYFMLERPLFVCVCVCGSQLHPFWSNPATSAWLDNRCSQKASCRRIRCNLAPVVVRLQLARTHCWLQFVGQGGEDLVELLVALALAAFGPPAPPQEPELKFGAKNLQKLRLWLEPCKETTMQIKSCPAGQIYIFRFFVVNTAYATS